MNFEMSSGQDFNLIDQENEAPFFRFPTPLPPLDFSRLSELDCQNEFEALNSMEMITNDPLFNPFDLVLQQQNLIQDQELVNTYGCWSNSNEIISCEYGEPKEQFGVDNEIYCAKDWKTKCVTNNSSKTVQLSHKTISKYFYVPISQAAKELNIGLTLLKKRCRELGIRRWPHRKLISLQTLITNIKEMDKERQGEEGNEEKMREAIEILEKQRRKIEEEPDKELEDKTKRLRQACFKANYKKRKSMGVKKVMHSTSSSSDSCSNNCVDTVKIESECDGSSSYSSSSGNFEEDMMMINLLLGYPFPPPNLML